MAPDSTTEKWPWDEGAFSDSNRRPRRCIMDVQREIECDAEGTGGGEHANQEWQLEGEG
jgi:hypothetical protein